MDLSKIIAINGKPGLFKLISHVKNNFVIEDIEKKNRLSISQNHQVSLLENIAIYTTDEEVPLKEVFQKIGELESYGPCISPKEDSKKLRAYMTKVLPTYDSERVYDSDLKKLFKWYNLLIDAQLISKEPEIIVEESEE